MKKTVLWLLALALVLTAAACGAPRSDAAVSTRNTQMPPGDEPSAPSAAQSGADIQMTVKEQTVAGDAESVTLTIANASGRACTYGAPWTLEAEKDGVWVDVEPLGTMMWIEILYTIAAGESKDDELTINRFYGTLDAGQYRVVKTFTDPDGSALTVYAAFTVQ